MFVITSVDSIQSLQCFHTSSICSLCHSYFLKQPPFKHTDRSSVTFLLCLPLVRSPQWLNTHSAEVSEAGKASISRANDARIRKRWQFFADSVSFKHGQQSRSHTMTDTNIRSYADARLFVGGRRVNIKLYREVYLPAFVSHTSETVSALQCDMLHNYLLWQW